MLSGRGENRACAVPTPIFQLNVRLSTARPHYETLVTLTFLMLHASRHAQPIHEAENPKAVGRTRCDAEVQARTLKQEGRAAILLLLLLPVK